MASGEIDAISALAGRAIQKSLDKLGDRALSLSKGMEMHARFDKLSVRAELAEACGSSDYGDAP